MVILRSFLYSSEHFLNTAEASFNNSVNLRALSFTIYFRFTVILHIRNRILDYSWMFF